MTAIETTPTAASRLDVATLPDDELLSYIAGVAEQRAQIVEDLRRVEDSCKTELKRRMVERSARALLDPRFEKIALEEVWTQYTFDLPMLHKAAELLRAAGHDEEAAKILKHIPEQITIIDAHYEAGPPVSINALIKKYGESEIGLTLCAAMSRQKVDERLVLKPAAPKSIGGAA